MAEDAKDEDGYVELNLEEADIPSEWQSVGVYTLELPARCPHCREPIRTLRVLKLTRTQVSFTSSLPRGGRALICPLCERIISAELSGIL
jgi:hypothetical protein